MPVGRLELAQYNNMSNNDEQIQTVSKILRNRKNVIREHIDIYKCLKCEGTRAGRYIMTCPDPKCRGEMRYFKRIPRSRVEEITSRRAARQCPKCMRTFYVWVEFCPYCSTNTLKGSVVRRESLMAKLFDYQMKV